MPVRESLLPASSISRHFVRLPANVPRTLSSEPSLRCCDTLLQSKKFPMTEEIRFYRYITFLVGFFVRIFKRNSESVIMAEQGKSLRILAPGGNEILSVIIDLKLIDYDINAR